MAGSKTRFGFVGNGEEPPHEDESRSARTIIGRDVHLQMPAGIVPPGVMGSPLPPAPPVRMPSPRMPAMIPMMEEITAQIPARQKRQHKSRLARFLGHWTDSGRFESSSRMNDSSHARNLGDQDFQVPRDSTGRNVLLVVIAAVLAFAITFALVKLRQRYASHGHPANHLVEGAALARQLTRSSPTEAPSAPPLVTAPTLSTAPTQVTGPTNPTVPTPPTVVAPLAPLHLHISAPASKPAVPSTSRIAAGGLAATSKVPPHEQKPPTPSPSGEPSRPPQR